MDFQTVHPMQVDGLEVHPTVDASQPRYQHSPPR